jgi:hypothetical protein
LEFFFRRLEAKDFKKTGTYRLLGWLIETYSKKKNKSEGLGCQPDSLGQLLRVFEAR